MYIYESASATGSLTSDLENAIANTVHANTFLLTLKFMKCQQQNNNRDCMQKLMQELAFKGDTSFVRDASGDILRFQLIECRESL